MEPIVSTLFSILVTLALPMFLITAMVTHTNHGELWRPLIGNLLFRKPKITRDMDTMLLFKVGNHGEHVLSFVDLNHSYVRIERFIKKSSWFRQTDMRMLKEHYDLMWNAIYRHEQKQQRAAQQEKERQRERAARQKSQKPGQNAQIPEWRRILCVDAHCRDPKIIKANYRRLVSKEHPDKGGSGKRMPEFNRAIDAARNELGFV